MDPNAVYRSVTSIYVKHDPENLLRNQLKEDDDHLIEVFKQVRQIWNEPTPDDSVLRNNPEELSVAWLRGILEQKIDTGLYDAGPVGDRESLEAYIKSCVDINKEMVADTEKQKKKNEEDCDGVIENSTLYSRELYTPVDKEVEECVALMKELTEKIKKIKTDKSIPANKEYNVVLDKGLRTFADKVKQIEMFITAATKIHNAQKIQDKASECDVYEGDLSRGIGHLAERAQIITYMLEQNREDM